MECCLRIRRAVNGFVVEYDDPEIRARNRKSDHWQDPEKSLVFADSKTLIEGMTTLIESMPEPSDDDFAITFNEAVTKL
jgi:hypothetical protein